MAYLQTRNRRLDPRFADIAEWYKRHGETWRVRWDYAFYQMAIETNFLTYLQGNGRWGAVDPKQNNFAGIGTTGQRGVKGDWYPDVSTGVLAQIQHLVVYSGERIEKPVAPRTQLKQDDILALTARANRPMTFAELSRRWATDWRYGRSIEFVAERYRAAYCNGRDEPVVVAAVSRPASSAPPPGANTEAFARERSSLGGPKPFDRLPASQEPGDPKGNMRVVVANVEAFTTTIRRETAKAAARPAPKFTTASSSPSDRDPRAISATPGQTAIPPAAGTAAAAPACRIFAASYGGSKTLLVRAEAGNEVQFTALSVLDGFEQSMLDGFVRTRAPGGTSVGEFPTRDLAIERATELCGRVSAQQNAAPTQTN